MSELQGLQSHVEDFEAAGAVVVAISADTTDEAARLAASTGLKFPILADPYLIAIDAFHLRHPGGDIAGGDIARPALFVVDRQGIVRWRFVTDNWRIRGRSSELLSLIRTL